MICLVGYSGGGRVLWFWGSLACERGATWVPICSWSLGLSSVRLLLLRGLVKRPRMACRC